MRKTVIPFPGCTAECVFPDSRANLPAALAELNLRNSRPVIVLVGGVIQPAHADVTQKAIEVIGAFAGEKDVAIICGGSDLGVMASIGRTRLSRGYRFPLLGINLEKLVTWPGGPRSKGWLWWREQRVPLAPGYSHFLLVPGAHYGEDSAWIADAAEHLSKGHRSVTILGNGGSVSRTDVALSLEHGRPVIALAGTGRLADELAGEPNRSASIASVQASDQESLRQILQLAIQQGE